MIGADREMKAFEEEIPAMSPKLERMFRGISTVALAVFAISAYAGDSPGLPPPTEDVKDAFPS